MVEKTITIEYARERLGKRAERMTDKDIQDLINMIRAFCNRTIDAVVAKEI